MPIMEYVHQPKVIEEIAEKGRKQIAAVDAFQNHLRGTVVIVKVISQGQPRAYADSVYESLILCYSPNSFTTNAPSLRWITLDQAKSLARIFVYDWGTNEKPSQSVFLEFIRPEKPSADLCPPESFHANMEGRSPLWRVRVVCPSSD